MARRRSRGTPWLAVLIGVVVIIALIESDPVVFGLVAIVVVAFFGYRYWRRYDNRRRHDLAIEEEVASQLDWLRETTFGSGELGDYGSVIRRVQHIGPQPLVAGIEEEAAIELKEMLEEWGGKARIKEGVVRVNGGGRREPIAEHVRHEVWRRDSGQCVDCGSRERLEFDHIVPISKGGSNTARNIELRCESCNRKKGAKV